MTAPRLGYVVRFVDSLDDHVRFYAEILGQRLSKRTDHWAQFDCGSLVLGLYDRATMAANLGVPEDSLGTAPGALELAFEVDDCDSAHAAAVAAGARSFRAPEDRPWGERTSYLLDPGGGLVELYTRSHRAGDASATQEARDGADQGSEERRSEMATPSSVSRQHSDPSD